MLEDNDQGEDEQGDEHMQDASGFSNPMFQGGGDFNQMQMMMAMQNSMGFPMMGESRQTPPLSHNC